MADLKPKRGSGAPNWGNFSKNLALWLLVILAGVALFQMMNNQRNPTQEFSYSEFRKQLDAGNISKVIVYDGKRLEGEFRTPVVQDDRPAKGFTVLLPVANSEEFFKTLEEANIPITAKEPKGGFTAFLIAALPWIVILGLWFFLLRQLQAGGSKAFSFGKSKAKLLTGDTPQVTFSDVAGADEAKGRTAGNHRIPEGSTEVHPAGGPPAEGCPAGGPARNRQDAVGQGSGRGGGAAILLDVGIRLRRDVRRCRGQPGKRPLRNKGRRMPPASFSSTRSTPWDVTGARGSAVGMTSGSRR